MKSVTPIDKNLGLDEFEVSAKSGNRRSLKSLIGELRQRRVCRAAITYVLVVWLNLQIGDVLFPMLGLPDWTLKLIIILGAMGFPAVLLLAWVFQVTPNGIVIDETSKRGDASNSSLDLLINSLLLLFSFVLTVLLITQFMSTGEQTAQSGVKIKSVSVHSASIDERSRSLANRIENELKHRVVNMPGVMLLADTAELPPKNHTFTPGLIISGSVSRNTRGIHALIHLIDAADGRYLLSSAFEIDLESSETPEEVLADKIIITLEPEIRITADGDSSSA